MKTKNYDAIVIGFGKGGKTLTGTLAGLGKKVATIEQSDKMYGGTCINVGCLPSKTLKTSAEQSALLDGSFEEHARRYYAAVEERERLTTMLRGKNYHKLADLPNVDVIDGRGKFVGTKEVEITFADGHTENLSAPQIFINTGSVPRLPKIEGAADSRYVYLSDTLMALTELPKHLVIIGGGYIGVEFASMYRHFGAQVTVVQNDSQFLPREDKDIADAVLKRLNDMGIEVMFDVDAKKIADKDGFAELAISTLTGDQKLEADAILLAAGRVPNTAELGLTSAGIEVNERGAVVTDEHLRTTNPAVYAMGDVVGGLQFTYISLDDFRIVKSAVLGNGERTTENRGAVPYSVFLDPPFSRVGLTEQQARDKGYEVKIAAMPTGAIPKAQVIRQTEGLLKAVVDAKTGFILGAHLFCPESHEMINLVKLAMDAKLPYTVLRDMIFTHPTLSEGFNDLFALVK